jgi:hypothetical protein
MEPIKNNAQKIKQEAEPLDIDLDDDCEDGLDMTEIMNKVNSQLNRTVKKLPSPRKSTSIQIKFTDRGPIPTTVARESEDGNLSTQTPNK